MTTVTSPPPLTGRALTFVEPLPGFPDHDQYTLTAIDPDGVLLALRSVRDPGLRFVLTAAGQFFPAYAPELPEAVGTALDAAPSDELRVLLVLTIGDQLSAATANLRAPVVVSERTGRAMQVVLDDPSLPMQQPLLDS
jgi:flagellar assembly factor FliW